MGRPATLARGARTQLRNPDGSPLARFSVVCTWDTIVRPYGLFGLRKKSVETDLDLNCAMFDGSGKMIDHIYSPLFRPEFLDRYGMPPGKIDSADGALHHSGELLEWTSAEHLNREVITVDLTRLNPAVEKIIFFLNNCGNGDFAEIPRTQLDIVPEEKTPFLSFAVPSDPKHSGCSSLVMARLDRDGDLWQISAIGDVTPDKNLCETILRISVDYLG